MSAPTPGPWLTRLSNDGSGKIGIVADRGCIAECFHDIRKVNEDAHDELLANSRLIAAAPNLLDACQQSLMLLQRWNNLNEKEAYQTVSKAIAKATGSAA